MASILQGGKRPAPMAAPAEEPKPMMNEGGGGESHSIIHHMPDGTHSASTHEGPPPEHHGEGASEPGHLHKAMAHIAEHHGEGMHHFTHHDGMGGGMTTHETAHGEPHEAHDHENLESVKDGMNKFFNEEEKEGGDWGEDEGKEPKESGATARKDYE